MVGDYMIGSDMTIPTIAAALTRLLALEVRKIKYSFSEITSKGEMHSAIYKHWRITPLRQVITLSTRCCCANR